jgi:ABC-type nickel/cobalt efflux system permease component RcnA
VRQVRADITAAPAAAGSPSIAAPGSASTQAAGPAPARAGALSLARSRDGLAELVTTATLTPGAVALTLVTAIVLGALHALSPGHGKTIVGAYLVGSRGTAGHALFLGLTVTAVHTAGVFALGLATLFASRYVVPERVYPWLSLVSGLLVLALGASLARTRLAALRGRWPGARLATASATRQAHGAHDAQAHDSHRAHHAVHEAHAERGVDHERHAHAAATASLAATAHAHGVPAHHHDHDQARGHGSAHGDDHGHDPHHTHHLDHDHDQAPGHEHSHGHDHGFGRHSHAIPGGNGERVTWRSLLALGISGGLLPCPSALVVMLGAIALQRVAFGIVLVVFFSLGLAATLMAIGLAMVYSGRLVGRLSLVERLGVRAGGWLPALARLLPVGSAAVVALAGLALTVEAAGQLDVLRSWADAALRSQAAGLVLLALLAALATTLAFGLRRGRLAELSVR